MPMTRRVPFRLLMAGLMVLAVLCAIALAWKLGDGLGVLKAVIMWLSAFKSDNPALTAGVFLLAHITIAALWLPMEIIMMVAAGALFGFVEGVILASFGTSIGATLALLEARYLLRDMVRRRFAKPFAIVDEGMKRDGPFYLFSLRLLPVFPFFLTNVTMGLTSLPARTFYIVSQVALLPAVMVYVNAGTQLARLESLSDIMSPRLLLTLGLLGLLPWIGKFLVSLIRRR